MSVFNTTPLLDFVVLSCYLVFTVALLHLFHVLFSELLLLAFLFVYLHCLDLSIGIFRVGLSGSVLVICAGRYTIADIGYDTVRTRRYQGTLTVFFSL